MVTPSEWWRGSSIELVSSGHEVTLFANSGDSKTTAKLHAVWPQAFASAAADADLMVVQAALLEAVAGRSNEFDVIHTHIDWLHLPLRAGLDPVSDHLPWAHGFAGLSRCGPPLSRRALCFNIA